MKIYTLDGIAEILKLSTQTVRKLIENGKLKMLDTDGAIRITEKQLNDYLEGK